jgi:hypothetical protein
MSKHYSSCVFSLTQKSQADNSWVSTHSFVEIATQMEAIEQRANAADDDVRVIELYGRIVVEQISADCCFHQGWPTPSPLRL